MDPEESDYRTIFSRPHDDPIFPSSDEVYDPAHIAPPTPNTSSNYVNDLYSVIAAPILNKPTRRILPHQKPERYQFIAKVLLVMGIVTLFTAYVPSLWYSIAERAGVELNTKYIKDTVKDTDLTLTGQLQPSVYQPPLDTSLSLENKLTIGSVGIDTVIHEAQDENYEDALKKGVWRVADFGSPFSRELPTILAAHRFGYLKWSVPYRLKNSFFNLPKVKVGDTIEVVWQQRKYTYSVYAEEKGEEISDYKADLILYTCQDLNSSVRIFKYAKLLHI